jgi:XTP/dITP diphosphohydrolase
MRRKIILSSGNKHKVKEIKDILKKMPFDVVSKDEIGFEDFDVIEDRETLEENALKKATELKKLINGIVIADDTGLFVDVLDGQPGVYSARYAGENVSYIDNNNLLLENLKDVPLDKRTAHFKTVVAVLLENDEYFMAEGVLKGRIGFEPKGENGFGYDPLFILEDTDKTLSEITDDEKNKISHRAKALLNLKERLEKIAGENISTK